MAVVLVVLVLVLVTELMAVLVVATRLLMVASEDRNRCSLYHIRTLKIRILSPHRRSQHRQHSCMSRCNWSFAGAAGREAI